MLKKTTFREIRKSLGRYIAIVAIVALGVGFFSGLKVTRSDMVSTADDYLIDYNLFDFQFISTLGFKSEQVSKVAEDSNVAACEGSVSMDFLYDYGDVQRVAKASSILNKINTLKLSYGRMPKANNECLADNNTYSKKDIGKKIKLSSSNTGDDLKKFKYGEYTIVGICESPVFLNYERGTTSLGNGSISCFMYIPFGGFDVDYFTEIYVDVKTNSEIYSDKYKNEIEKLENPMEALCILAAKDRFNEIYDAADRKLSKAKAKYQDGYNDFITQKESTYTKLKDGYEKITDGQKKLDQEASNLSKQKTNLTKNKADILSGLEDVSDSKQQLEAGKPYMPENEYLKNKGILDATEKQLNTSLAKVNTGLKQIASGEASIALARKELKTQLRKYYDSKDKADTEFAKAEKKLNDAKEKIDKGQKDLSKLEKPKTYVLTRDDNIGYACFENDSSLIDGIAKVFPIFFFLVAALVCMTTMTRMVDEQRTQIGVFKALGYSNNVIMGEYMFYSGSAATLGTLIGFFGGCYLFPKVIWAAYGMMYDFNPKVNYIYDWKLGLFSLTAALLCSMGSTFISCRNDFKIVPAELIRPKAPKNGKRILLERITPLWSKISFLYKVTLRNIFRYKKRFFMMVLGISGCTALLLTGFGVNDSVKNIVEYQYDEIMTYDYSVIFDEPATAPRQKAFIDETKEYAKDIYFLSETSVDFIKGKNTKSLKLIVSDGKNIESFINLHTKKDAIPFPGDGEAVICNEVANRYDVSIGDTITIRNSNREKMQVKVSAICENYIYDYIYTNENTCNNAWGYVPEYKTAFVKAADNTREGVSTQAAKVSELDNVVATSVNNDMRDRINSMMTSIDSVILLVVLSAGALAFIVLYNLTNINITERIREIATIKVLGFYPNETSAYVFRENFILTGISAVVGLFLGKLLHAFVMSQLKIDLISFDIRIVPLSYVLSVALTFLFAIIVSVAMYFKLNKISMTESLKSIE